MADTIAAEHFDLTPAVTQHLRRTLQKVRSRLKPSSTVHLAVSLENKDCFTARLHTRVDGRDLASRASSQDFKQAVNQARDHLLRQLAKGG